MTLSGYGRLISTTMLSAALLSACGGEENKPAAQDKPAATTPATQTENTLAMVNGKAITMDDLTFFLNARQEANPMEPASPELVLNELINRELLVTEARKQGIDKKPEIVRMTRIQNESLLANELLAEKLQNADTSDAALKAEYDSQIAALDLNEFKASHILLKTEEDALAVIEELAQGAEFAALAQEKSTGPSGPNGGDLGWFQSDSMVAEFGNAVKAMTKGDVSKTPVKTDFGWHVIFLEDTRTKELPKFEDVKPQLGTIVANKQVEKYLEELRNSGNVELMRPSAENTTETKLEAAPPADTAAPAAPASEEKKP